MIYEGRIAAIYFENLKKIFNRLAPEFNFYSRKGKSYSWNSNASDEVNALFNYGYSILESEVKKVLNSVGFDAGIGFLHEIIPSKTPLIYDVMELFRWIVDYSIIQLLEDSSRPKKSDFIVTENYNIRLRENTAKLLIEKIKNNFNAKASYRGKNYSYQTILQDNIAKLANFILNKTEKIEFAIPKLIIRRDDSVSLQEKILSMTPSERKRLGINKSTLWYMRKNLQSRDKIKIYDKVLDRVRSFEQQYP